MDHFQINEVSIFSSNAISQRRVAVEGKSGSGTAWELRRGGDKGFDSIVD